MTKKRTLLASGVVALGLLAAIGSGDEEAKKVDSSGTDAGGDDSGADAPPQVFKVGDTVELGDLQVVVHGVTDPYTASNEFITPAAGQRWVAVDVEVKNTSDKAVPISSLAQFEVQDATNAAYPVTITGDTLATIDGEAAAQGARRGTMVFEVPAAATGLKLNFKGDIFSSGSATVVLG